MSYEQIAGMALVIVAAILMVALAVLFRKPSRITFRNIPALQRLWKSVGQSVEAGKRLHVSLGNAGILSPNNATALVGLSALERLALLSMVSDKPPLTTSADGSLAILSQDTLRFVYRKGNALGKYDALRGRMSGVTPFSYAVGTLPALSKEDILTNVLIGHYGPEVALLAEFANQRSIYTLAASDSLTAQAVMVATTQDTLIGEELYAIPAYLKAGPFHRSSLHTQDILRWILVIILLAGVVMVLLEQFLGVSLL